MIGDSAGGALASLVGLTGSDNRFKDRFDAGPWRDESDKVNAVVDLFGPVNRRWYASKWRDHFGSRPTPVFGELNPRLIRSASAVSYVRPDSPRFLIVQGLKDKIDPPWLSIGFYRKLREDGDPARIILVRNASHELVPSGGSPSPTVPVVVKAITAFLEHTGTTTTQVRELHTHTG